MGDALKAPFPWFGGKSRAAALIWPRFGDVANYVEPFFGSGAVLLARPHAPRIETVNDVDALLCNFWRSIRMSPEATAEHADGPVDEADLHSKHRWLVNRKPQIRELIQSDPEAHDPKIAGWWVWGLCAWIGSGWCSAEAGGEVSEQMPALVGNGGGEARGPGRPGHDMGIHSKAMRGPAIQLPNLGGACSDGDKPRASGGMRGIHAAGMRGPAVQLPHLGGGSGTHPRDGQGIHGAGMRGPSLRGVLSEQLPDLGGNKSNVDDKKTNLGRGMNAASQRTRILETFQALSARLRGVRVACGDFERILSDSVTWRHGTTAVLLDPEYPDGADVYAHSDKATGEEHVFYRAARWAAERGSDTRLRIALCGYEGTWSPPSGWSTVEWKAKGGYGGQRGEGKAKNDNAARERIWFSPGCLSGKRQASLFDFFESKDS